MTGSWYIKAMLAFFLMFASIFLVVEGNKTKLLKSSNHCGITRNPLGQIDLRLEIKMDILIDPPVDEYKTSPHDRGVKLQRLDKGDASGWRDVGRRFPNCRYADCSDDDNAGALRSTYWIKLKKKKKIQIVLALTPANFDDASTLCFRARVDESSRLVANTDAICVERQEVARCVNGTTVTEMTTTTSETITETTMTTTPKTKDDSRGNVEFIVMIVFLVILLILLIFLIFQFRDKICLCFRRHDYSLYRPVGKRQASSCVKDPDSDDAASANAAEAPSSGGARADTPI